ncbi:unnamed protein product [Cylicocyclus nassatus]|uniref:Uncharacterized protein n=1 Tax=Cylicocyclus nassatus TaxID=53992 RepID=A0AA36MC16_CYLNA|nr:unnamed protein product [Cylicocyclus nassatus]
MSVVSVYLFNVASLFPNVPFCSGPLTGPTHFGLIRLNQQLAFGFSVTAPTVLSFLLSRKYFPNACLRGRQTVLFIRRCYDSMSFVVTN